MLPQIIIEQSINGIESKKTGGKQIMLDKRFEELKSELFSWGRDYIEEFLGFEYDFDWDKDTIDNAMDEVYEQMPEEELEVFYQKFNIR